MAKVQIDNYYGTGIHRIIDEEEYYDEQQNKLPWYKWDESRPFRLFGLTIHFVIISLELACINDFKGGMEAVFWIGIPSTISIS